MVGGKLIQSLLDADLIDELIITIFPILLGEGIPLFSRLNRKQFSDLVNIQKDFGLSMMTYSKKIEVDWVI